MKESICQGQETIRPKIRIVEREAKLVRLWDWEIARLVGEASIVMPIITVYEGVTEEDASFLVKLQEGLYVTKNELLLLKYFAKI